MPEDTAIEMTVGGLLMDPNTQAPVVILKDEAGDIVLPIWIGIAEATSIATALKQVDMTRPLTHDLLKAVFDELRVAVDRVVITDLKDSTYFAELVLVFGDRALILDTRPSDAIAIALRYNAPIFVTQQVLQKAKVAFSSNVKGVQSKEDLSGTDEQDENETNFANLDKEKWSEILEGLDPKDFKYKV